MTNPRLKRVIKEGIFQMRETVMVSTGDLSRRWRVPQPVIVKIIDRLGIGHRVGQVRAVLTSDIHLIDTGLRAMGWTLPQDVQHSEQVETTADTV
jgi:hypothetical protein